MQTLLNVCVFVEVTRGAFKLKISREINLHTKKGTPQYLKKLYVMTLIEFTFRDYTKVYSFIESCRLI